MAESFRTFVQGLVTEHGTAGSVAKAIGMSLSAFSRGVRLEGTLGVEKCLKLAQWSGAAPSHVLRLAKKGEVADLIEDMYGPARSPVSEDERELTELWRDLEPEPDARRAFFTLLRALAAATRAKRVQPSLSHRKRA